MDRLTALVRAGLPAAGLPATGFSEQDTIGIALSGGGDSTALLHLALRAGLRVSAVTVDHRLRRESADEAARVAAACAALGVAHEIRVWDHGVLRGNLMDAARRARIGLILDWARDRGIGTVALGHTRDDQAETVLMGLARAGGLPGLSGMRSGWVEAGVSFCRPLLGAGRKELRDWLGAEGIGWIDDPSNDDDRFTRIKARRALAALAPLGITADRLAEVAGHLAEAQAALAPVLASAGARLIREDAGALWLDPGLQAEPVEIRRQLVRAAVLWLTGTTPRATELARFMAALADGRDATLAGCRLWQGWIFREARALGGPVAMGDLWDGRWRVSADVNAGVNAGANAGANAEGRDGPPGEVRALGGAGLGQCPDWRATGLPRKVLEITPALWRSDRLVSAPLAGLAGECAARIERPFHLFGLSH